MPVHDRLSIGADSMTLHDIIFLPRYHVRARVCPL
jgi:hypothetical protein